MNLTFRDATIRDAEALYLLAVQLGGAVLSRADFNHALERALTDGEVHILVAELANELVALATLSIRPQLRLGGLLISIDEFVVAEQRRGHSVGGRLLAHICQQARVLGARRVELHTRRTRESYARGFYVKHGFTDVDSAVLRWEPT